MFVLFVFFVFLSCFRYCFVAAVVVCFVCLCLLTLFVVCVFVRASCRCVRVCFLFGSCALFPFVVFRFSLLCAGLFVPLVFYYLCVLFLVILAICIMWDQFLTSKFKM